MKKVKILSGTGMVLLLIWFLTIEIGSLVLWRLVQNFAVDIFLIFWSIVCIFALLVTNRLVTIVTYDPEKEIISRRGLFGEFHKELCVADILRTEVRMIPKEREYILLIDKEMPYFDSLSPDMPIRVPNTTRGRSFVALFYSSEH